MSDPDTQHAQQIMDDLGKSLVKSRRLILVECDRQGWPEQPVHSEVWSLFQAIETACSSYHNIAVARGGNIEINDQSSVQDRYYELIYEVATKHPGESRHETAKRYIHERENRSCDEGADSAGS